MPHDKHGKIVQPGDRVTVEFVVKQVHQGEDYCNLGLETVEPMYPGNHKTAISVNSRQAVVIVEGRSELRDRINGNK